MQLLTESYRPKCREDIVGNKSELDRLFGMVNSGKLCHVVLEGPAGTGKSSTALVIAKQLFKEWIKSNFLELNASDERGIDVVREQIKTFAKTSAFNSGFKIILLDEGDEMTPEAQNALRRIMEKYSDICIFIFAVNAAEKLIDPIKSRCEIFHFGPLSVEDITERLFDVYASEKGIDRKANFKRLEDSNAMIITVETPESSALRKVAEYSQGDMRKALNHLQVLLASGEALTSETVETLKPVDYGKIIFDSLQKGRFLEARQNLYKAFELGYAPRYIIQLIHKVYISAELSISVKADAIFELAECDFRMTQGVDKQLAFDKLLLKLLNQIPVNKT